MQLLALRCWLLAVVLLPSAQAQSYDLKMSNLGQAYMRNFVVDGDYIYMSGSTFNDVGIYGNVALGGGSDALLVKLFVSNMSVVYVRQYGGNSADYAGLCSYSFSVSGGLYGLTLSPKDDIIAVYFMTESSNIVGVVNAANNRISPLPLFQASNGTLLKYVNDFVYTSSTSFGGAIMYSQATQSFVYQATLASLYSPLSALVYINGTVGLRTQPRNPGIIRNAVVTTTEIVTTADDYYGMTLYGYRIALSNLSITSQYLLTTTQSVSLQGITYVGQYNRVLMTGSAFSEIDGLPCMRGSGSIVVLQWNLQNGSLTCLTRYGSVGSDQQAAFGIEYELTIGLMYVTGLISGSLSLYGDYDAVLLTYSRNLTLLSSNIIGGPGCDSFNDFHYPYAMISAPVALDASFGGGSGPGLMRINALMSSETFTEPHVISTSQSVVTSAALFEGPTRTSQYQSQIFAYSRVESLSSQQDAPTTQPILQIQTIGLQVKSKIFLESQSTVTNVVPPTSQSDATSQSSLIYAIAGAIVLLLTAAILLLCRRYRRKRSRRANKQTYINGDDTYKSVTVTDQSSFIVSVYSSTTSYQQTTMIAGKEIALPGFLQATDGIDFKTDYSRPAIAEGGGGIIRHCQVQNYGVGAMQFKTGILDAVVKQVKGTSSAVFKQEVGLMFYFRDCPCIIKLLAFNMSEMLIVMPYFDKGPLNQMLTDQSIGWSLDVILQLAIDVFEALVVIHEAGVVHCDIKSQNYLVELTDGQLRAVLTDFGVCIVLNEASTVAGMALNTVKGKSVSYSAPEVWQSVNGQQLTPDYLKKRDVYAGAVILNELLTRQMAWKHPRNFSMQEIRQMVLAGERPLTQPFQQIAGDARTQILHSIVERGWIVDTEQRPSAVQIKQLILEPAAKLDMW